MSHVDEGRLHAFLDGDLTPGTPEHRDVEAHLKECADCRNRLEQARLERDEAAGLLGLLGPARTDGPAFEELRIRAAESARSPAPASRRRPRIPLTWAASIAVALGGGWLAHGAWDSLDPAIERPPALRAPAEDAGVREDAIETPAPTGEAPSDVAPPPPATDAAGQAAEEETTPPDDASRALQEDPPATEPPSTGAGSSAAEPPPALVPEADALPRVLDFEALSAEAARPELAALARVLSEAEARADSSDAWEPVTPAEAAEHLGRVPFEPAGVPWERMEATTVDGRALVRTRHPLASGDRLEVIQAPWSDEARLPRVITGNPPAAAQLRRSAADEVAAEPLHTLFLPHEGPGPARGTLAVHLEAERLGLVLHGPGDRDALEALWERVR